MIVVIPNPLPPPPLHFFPPVHENSLVENRPQNKSLVTISDFQSSCLSKPNIAKTANCLSNQPGV